MFDSPHSPGLRPWHEPRQLPVPHTSAPGVPHTPPPSHQHHHHHHHHLPPRIRSIMIRNPPPYGSRAGRRPRSLKTAARPAPAALVGGDVILAGISATLRLLTCPATPVATISSVRWPNQGWSRPVLPGHGQLAASEQAQFEAARVRRGWAGPSAGCWGAHQPSPTRTALASQLNAPF